MKAEIGVLGMGVMGKSLSRNLAHKGHRLAIYNRHVDGQEENVAADFKQAYPELEHTQSHDDLQAFVDSMETPRKIIIMVNAGAPTDAVLSDLGKVLDAGDIVIDGGNSHFEETKMRIDAMKAQGIFYIGTGVSGGEEGALKGPSIMPSGDKDAYAKVKKYLESISAKDADGKPCCTYIGKDGSGHFVKMIHNGIEYAEMQLLAECYAILKSQGLTNDTIADELESWMSDLGSYLLGITVDILRKKEGNAYLLDLILDKAANKGTGKWATTSIADSGEAATMIPAALFARYLSFFKEIRNKTAKVYHSNSTGNDVSTEQLKEAYQFGRIINHHQGFSLIDRISNQRGWDVQLSEIARIWTEGCIIKSDLMKELVDYLKTDCSILLNDKLIPLVKQSHRSAQAVAMVCIQSETHCPCLIEAVNYFHGVKTANSSANMIQAQRDYFGAHTYRKITESEEKSFHTEW